ncbi:MAG: hypothetical protein P8R54_22050 [Myxococcota bacterium]|nr:hypothetical protein [Myxococcota bacterium]
MSRRVFSILAVLAALTGCRDECDATIPFGQSMDCDHGVGSIGDAELVECDIMMSFTVSGAAEASDAAALIVASIENVSGAPQTVTVTEACPDGLVAFEGLGDGVDYYGSCLAGDCADYGESVAYTLAPGEVLEEEVIIRPDGDDCNAPMDAGTYIITGALSLTEDDQPIVCATSATLEIAG